MTASPSRFIREIIRENGIHAQIVIQIRPITLCLIALPAILMHIEGRIIPMHNVINAIPGDNQTKTEL
jgi:hypothetical protein